MASRAHETISLSSTRLVLILSLLATLTATAADRTALDQSFADTVHPFLETYCFACHNKEKHKGQLDLSSYTTTQSIAADYRRWDTVIEKLKQEEMPPEEAKKHPTPELRSEIVSWIQALRKNEAERTAGDPGVVLARRLSNAEYDYTIRDLTGVDPRLGQKFPVDPANQAGFDNSGESLSMSPTLVTKYLEAAREIAEHVVLKPSGFVFAPHPVVTDPDRDKYCVKRIMDFYQRQPTDYADYFMAAWRFRHRSDLDQPAATLNELAAKSGISAKYLGLVWDALTDSANQLGPLEELRTMWQGLPTPQSKEEELARSGCERMRDFILEQRRKLTPTIQNLAIRGIAPGSQPFVLWKDNQLAAYRRRFELAAWPNWEQRLPERGDASDAKSAEPSEESTSEEKSKLPFDLPTDAAARTEYTAALNRFCRVFPDAFYVSERVLIFLKEDKDSRGRLLSAGFHLMTGYFRDDTPLDDLILDDQGRRELNELWEEFHFITLDYARQYRDFIFFERAEPPRFMQGAEFDFARSEDKDATSVAKMNQLAEAYMAKARRNGGTDTALNAIEDYFKTMSTEIRTVEQARLVAEPSHLHALLDFAQRAYRRPLTQPERDDLLAFYHSLRENDGLDHEEAIRDTIVSVLMSPHFCYRVDLSEGGRDTLTASEKAEVSWKLKPLSDYALASRLSYFLWSSMPDAELLRHAEAGDLHKPQTLLTQTRRMLLDERVRGLVTEFGGNWLDFRRFEEHNAVDRERFKSFNNELRAAMFEEPIQFFLDVIRRDRPVLDFLEAQDTFVNPVLAQHYGMPDRSDHSDAWVHVDQAAPFGRGGLLPMSVFLTKNSPGLRTSPVKRGYWVVRRLLGEEIPPPPPKVPELPSDEEKLGDLTLRELLERHREDKSCAGCHARFDALGLVFEGYGPIGEQRDRDLGGRPVDTRATFPGGSEGAGLDGLRRYLHEHRQQEFIDNLSAKLLVYALGRTLSLSDETTLADMRAKLQATDYRFSTLVETIVTSRQFLNQRAYN